MYNSAPFISQKSYEIKDGDRPVCLIIPAAGVTDEGMQELVNLLVHFLNEWELSQKQETWEKDMGWEPENG